MSELVNLLGKYKENLKTFIVSSLLALGTLYTGNNIVRTIFFWGNAYKLFGFEFIERQMSFCLHQTIFISVFAVISISFILDRIVLKNNYRFLSRKIFWIFLLIILLMDIISHYGLINTINYYEKNIFEQVKYIVCY